MLTPVVCRLLMLEWIGAPEPRIHDEFSHLLVADTLAHGRLANPQHPMWRHIETLYLLQRPTYSSIYPIGQGSILAAGQLLFGHPWAGVLLAVSMMSGGVAWALLGCLPLRWAAVGGLFAATAYGLHFDWVNSYWGGALCAFGGAVVFGALCRLRTAPSAGMGLLAGLGWMVIWLIRPFESLPVLLFLVGSLGLLARREWRKWAPTALLLAAGPLAGGTITLVHNRAVTGSATTLPYHVCQKEYGVPQNLLGSAVVPKPALRFHEAEEMYRLQLGFKRQSSEHLYSYFLHIVYLTLAFYCGPWLLIPLLMTLTLGKDRMVLAAMGLIAVACLAAVLYPFFFPHYIAALSVVMVYLVVRGCMELWGWQRRGKPLGRRAAQVLIGLAILTSLPVMPSESLIGFDPATPGQGMRGAVLRDLRSMGGRHLLFVRYGPGHRVHDEWVYNAAEVDSSAVVVCRSGNGLDDGEAVRYFSGRRVWLAEVMGETATLAPYDPLAADASQRVGRVRSSFTASSQAW